MEKSDEQLITEYFEGDEEALALLVRRYLTPLYNFIYRLSGNAGDAEDIVQEAFVKAWRHLKKFRRGANFKTWLFTIAHHTAIDHLRRRRRLVFSDFENGDAGNVLTDTLIDTESLPDELWRRAEDREYVEALLLRLSPAFREVLYLRYNEELTFDEIGGVLGKSIDTVKSQHRRALLLLRKLIDAPK